jgi:hypothetical protein
VIDLLHFIVISIDLGMTPKEMLDEYLREKGRRLIRNFVVICRRTNITCLVF